MSYKKSQENERDCVVGFVWWFGWFLFAFYVAVTHFECALFGEAKTAFLEGSLLQLNVQSETEANKQRGEDNSESPSAQL